MINCEVNEKQAHHLTQNVSDEIFEAHEKNYVMRGNLIDNRDIEDTD
jgi:hypothetical protein